MHKLKFLSGDARALIISGEAMHPPEVRSYTESLPRNIVRFDITIEVSVQWEKSVYKSLKDIAKTGLRTLTSLKDVRITYPFGLLPTAKRDLQKLKLLFQEQGVTFTWSATSDEDIELV
jgi:hypothetical protein